ncbi:MAG TPA: Co2+/Mg2+ efflux protein ApaG [Ignavibacteria bacterium]|nr:Co2+/Mg2+ efflux protein ApaG [Ignavibacteria bacterium]
MQNNTASVTITDDIKVEVFPEYLPEQSEPEKNRYFFSYRVLITNLSNKSVRLISRHWIIINAEGDREDVEGPGVVGYLPELNPGESFEYSSSCPMDTEWGTMEGTYTFMREDGEKFKAKIGRFYLVSSKVTAE